MLVSAGLALVAAGALALVWPGAGDSGGAPVRPDREARPDTSGLDGNAPAAVEIPAIGVRAAVEPLGIKPSGAVQTPGDYGRVGWFAGGRPPGEAGPAVLLGHIDSSTGPAVFFRLGDLAAGDEVAVRRVDGAVVRFQVDRVSQVRKGEFPTEEVYGTSASSRGSASTLRLVTCAGPWDDDYRDNLIVYARRVA